MLDDCSKIKGVYAVLTANVKAYCGHSVRGTKSLRYIYSSVEAEEEFIHMALLSCLPAQCMEMPVLMTIAQRSFAQHFRNDNMGSVRNYPSVLWWDESDICIQEVVIDGDDFGYKALNVACDTMW